MECYFCLVVWILFTKAKKIAYIVCFRLSNSFFLASHTATASVKETLASLSRPENMTEKKNNFFV